MIDEEEFVREIARWYGHTEDDAVAARNLLHIRPRDLVVRFTDVAKFAHTYGVNILSLAALIAESGTGIEPWEPRLEFSSEDWKRIREAEERLSRPGDWAGTILALLDEVARMRGEATSGSR